MPSVMAHALVGACLAPWLVPRRHCGIVVAAGAACAMLPDADSIGLFAGIPYSHLLGHRGLTHSPAFALALSLGVGWALVRSLGLRRHGAQLAAYLFLCTASHGVLDAMTDGGLGVAFLAPFSGERFFLPWRPIEVSPISIARFMTGRGLDVLRSELRWVALPALAVGLSGFGMRLAAARRRAS